MNGERLDRIIAKGMRALQEKNPELARKLYEEAAMLDAEHTAVRRGLRELDALETHFGEIRSRIDEADQAYATGEYGKARDLYVGAYNFAGELGILSFHAELERNRNRSDNLQRWQQRWRECRKQVEQHKTQNRWADALADVEDFLQEIPDGDDALATLRAEVAKARQDIVQQLDVSVLVEEAIRQYEAENIYEAMRLFEEVPQDSPLYEKVAPRLRMARMYWETGINPHLEKAEEHFDNNEWPQAFGELEHLRMKWPESPEWRRLWLQVGEAYGQQELDNGRRANTARDFAAAEQHFVTAREQAFQRILDVYQDHGQAASWADEAADLARVAALEKQADLDWQAGRRLEALAALEEALRRLDHARTGGRDYAAVSATVTTMHQALESEIQRSRQDARTLAEATRLLADRRLDAALELYRATADAILPEHQAQALEGISRVETEKEAFAELRQHAVRAHEQGNLQQAVDAWQRAYEKWPGHPEIAGELVKGLETLAEQLHAAGKLPEAVKFAVRARELDPSNYRAAIIERIPDVQAKVAAALARTDELLDGSRQPASAQYVKQSVSQLNKLADQLRPDFPDLLEQVQARQEELRQYQETWEAYQKARDEGEELRRRGQWAQAVATLKPHLDQLASLAPHAAVSELRDWEQVARILEQGLPSLQQEHETVKSVYDNADGQPQYSQAVELVQALQKSLQQLERRALDAGGNLPPEYQELREAVDDLAPRAALAASVAASLNQPEMAAQALERVRLFADERRTDDTLTGLERKLVETLEKQIPVLLRQAKQHEQAGELQEALERLRLLRELRPDDPEATERYQQLARRKRVQDELRNIDQDYVSKLETNSPGDAVRAIRQAVDLFKHPESGLPGAAQEILRKLDHYLVESGGAMQLADSRTYSAARTQLQELDALISEPLVALALDYSMRWLQQARDFALLGVAESTALLDRKLDGYRAAQEYLNNHPNDERAITLVGNARTAVVNSLNASAEKRTERAEHALNQGLYQVALTNLESLEAEIYGPVEKEIPDFFNEDDRALENRTKAELLKNEAERLRDLDKRVQEPLKQAQQAFFEGNFDKAEQLLDLIGDVPEVAHLRKQVTTLRQKLTLAQDRRNRQRLAAGTSRIQVALLTAATPEDFVELNAGLEQLATEVNVERLAPEERHSYEELLDDVQARQRDLVESSRWHQEAQKAFAAAEYKLAVSAISKAIEKTRNPAARVEMQSLHDRASTALEAEEQQSAELEVAREALRQQHYVEAHQALRRAQERGASVAELIDVAQAGSYLLAARKAMEHHDWFIAEMDLVDALELLKDHADLPHAEDLLRRIKRDQRVLKRHRERAEAEEAARQVREQKELEANRQREEQERQHAAEEERRFAEAEQKRQRKLNNARVNLSREELDAADAEVQTVLEERPDHADALALLDLIQRTRRALLLLGEARAARSAGNYNEAQAKVEAILNQLLPEHTDAIALQKQIQHERPLAEALARAEKLAREGHFPQARQVLNDASGADQKQVSRVRSLILDLELEHAEILVRGGSFQRAREIVESLVGADREKVERIQKLIRDAEAQILEPIEQLLLDGDYSGALARCHQALLRTTSPDIRDRLLEMQQTIVDRRARQIINASRERFRTAESENDFTEVIANLETMLHHDPVPSGAVYRELNSFRYMAHAQRLQKRLDVADALAAEKRWEVALGQYEDVSRETVELAEAAAVDAKREASELARLAHAAERGLKRVEEAREAHDRQKDQERYGVLMRQAQEIFHSATERVHLEQAQRTVEQILAIARFRSDAEAIAWQQRLEEGIALYDRTARALDRARQLIYERQYEQAEGALGKPPTSPLLHEQFQTQRELIAKLINAKKAQYESQWRQALVAYEEIIAAHADLAVILQSDLERCRQKLVDTTLTMVQAALDESPPDARKATDLLLEAEENGWITPAYEPTVERLRAVAASYRVLAEAIEQLSRENGDRNAARAALMEAQHLLPDGEPDTGIAQWAYLTDALEAWDAGNWESAERLVAELLPPVALTPRARALAAAVQREQDQAAEVQRRYDQLQGWQQAARTALRLENYSDAVDLVRQSLELQPDHPLSRQTRQDVKTAVTDRLLQARGENHYAIALELRAHLLRLGLGGEDPEEANLRDLVLRLPEERRERLESALHGCRDAIDGYRLADAEGQLTRAQQIAAPDGDSRLEPLSAAVAQLRKQLLTVDRLISDAERHTSRKEWNQAVKDLQEVWDAAPGYPEAAQSKQRLQQRLLELARQWLAQARQSPFAYRQAQEFAELAGNLDDSAPAFLQFRRQLGEQRKEHLQQLLSAAQRSLGAWDLRHAGNLLKDAAQVEQSQQVDELQQRLTARLPQEAELRQIMEEGLQAVRERHYQNAADIFARYRETAADFDEGRSWSSYARNMDQARQNVVASNFEEALDLLKLSESILLLDGQARLPSLFGDTARLRRERRQAAFDAHRLQPTVARLVSASIEADSLSTRSDVRSLERAIELNQEVIDLKHAFQQLFEAQAKPPDSYATNIFLVPSASEESPSVSEEEAAADGGNTPTPDPAVHPRVAEGAPGARVGPALESVDQPMVEDAPAHRHPLPSAASESVRERLSIASGGNETGSEDPGSNSSFELANDGKAETQRADSAGQVDDEYSALAPVPIADPQAALEDETLSSSKFASAEVQSSERKKTVPGELSLVSHDRPDAAPVENAPVTEEPEETLAGTLRQEVPAPPDDDGALIEAAFESAEATASAESTAPHLTQPTTATPDSETVVPEEGPAQAPEEPLDLPVFNYSEVMGSFAVDNPLPDDGEEEDS